MTKIQQYRLSKADLSRRESSCENWYSTESPVSMGKAKTNRGTEIPYEPRLYGSGQKQNKAIYFSLADIDFDHSKGKKNIEQKSASAKFLSENDPDLLIKEYFLANLNTRAKLGKFIAKQINSPDKVLEILDYSRKRGIKESYDGAIDLLAECGNVLLRTIDNEVIKILDKEDILVCEEKLEVLLKGIACAYNIPHQERIKTIANLIPTCTRRLIKTAIIDALLILQDEVDSDTLKNYLTYFSSTNEPDEYVRQYAQEAIEEF